MKQQSDRLLSGTSAYMIREPNPEQWKIDTPILVMTWPCKNSSLLSDHQNAGSSPSHEIPFPPPPQMRWHKGWDVGGATWMQVLLYRLLKVACFTAVSVSHQVGIYWLSLTPPLRLRTMRTNPSPSGTTDSRFRDRACQNTGNRNLSKDCFPALFFILNCWMLTCMQI